MKNCFIILAAGKSERFKSSIPKPYYNFKGKPLYLHSIERAIESKIFEKIILVINKKHRKYIDKSYLKDISIINGGLNRSDSSKKAVKYIKKRKYTNVFIHDAARPNFSIKIIKNLLFYLKKYDGVVPAVNTVDSVKYKIKNKIINLNRENIYLTQTPQAFKVKILEPLQNITSDKITDESNILISNNKKIKIIKGDKKNIKITTTNDLEQSFKTNYGIGFDIHKLKKKKNLYLGGVKIPFHSGLDGHSDGDVIIHAMVDALLGACKLKDIGYHFSDKDKKFKNIRSKIMLNKIIKIIKKKGFIINNVDINLITENPKVSKIRLKIIKNLSKLCNIAKNKINLKGKTVEKLGLIGQEKAIACEVILSVINYD
tara:strand:- start:1549 stop:2664 length:1116 start_codon:yes stop_codon:yes gene_type:complete